MITVMNLDEYKKNVDASIEQFDGFDDGLWAECYESQEDLDFIEKFGLIEASNTKTKLDMLNKINKVYGPCNRGIENYCRIQSLEAEAAAVEKTNENSNSAAPNTDKKQKWYQILWQKIKSIFIKIKNLFISLWNKIKSLFSKHEETLRAVEEAPAEEIQSLSDYLAEVNINEDNSKKLVTISKDTPSLLIKKTGEYLQISTQFSDSVKNLTQYANINDVKKFVEMASKMYTRNGKEFNFGSMNGNDDMAYREFKDKVNKIANSFKYADNRNAYLSDFNSKLLNNDDNKKITSEMIMGTKNIKEIRNIFKELNSAINAATKNINKASDLCKRADSSFDNFINSNKNKENSALEIAAICTGMFKVVTNMSNIYLNIIQDMSNTMMTIDKFTISGAQKFISSLKKVGKTLTEWGLRLKGQALQIYKMLKPEVKRAYDSIVKKWIDYKKQQSDLKEQSKILQEKLDSIRKEQQEAVQEKLKENEVKSLISDLYKSCGQKMNKKEFVTLLQGTMVDNGFVSDKSEANEYIRKNIELASYLKETMSN